MIKINLLKLTQKPKLFEGTEPAEILEVKDTEFLKINSDIKYSIEASFVNNGVLIRGYAEVELLCECGICLCKYKYIVRNNDICHFYEKPNKNEIDLTDDIREDILISFPVNLKCSEDCKGICTKCGQNLNIKQCSCSNENENKNIWSELDNLKL